MSTLECSVCLENFKEARDVYSTDCGHIFHKDCLEQCKKNLPTFVCPQCRHPNPASHKIYITVDDTDSKENTELLKIEQKCAELKVEATDDVNENKHQFEKNEQNLNENQDQLSDIPSMSARNFLNEPFGMKALIIKGVAKDDIKTPLIETVFVLSSIMNIPCKNTDIEVVFILDRKFFLRPQNQYDKLNIVVKFTTQTIKNMFLDKKELLKVKGITLNEYVDEDTNELFLYAKTLHSRGYKNVFCRNNSIFVQKDDFDILYHIYSKQDVDNML